MGSQTAVGPGCRGLAGRDCTLGRDPAQTHLFKPLLGGATFSREALEASLVYKLSICMSGSQDGRGRDSISFIKRCLYFTRIPLNQRLNVRCLQGLAHHVPEG